MSAEGIISKGNKGGYVIAKFHSGGFFKLNSAGAVIGTNTAGETVQALNIVQAIINTGGANSVYYTVQRGGNTVLVLTGQDNIELNGMIIDNMGGEPQANVVVTKTGFGPSTLILKLHKRSAITGGSIY